jgi:hypothetical protein
VEKLMEKQGDNEQILPGIPQTLSPPQPKGMERTRTLPTDTQGSRKLKNQEL